MASRTQHAFRNILFGIFLKLNQTFLPFITRTVLIYTLGVGYVGLSTLFTAILQILNLAELGISQAITYAMYKPVVDQDNNKICGLLGLYKKYYFIIGFIILGIGFAFLPFLPNMITGEIPSDINIYILYIMYLLSTVSTYWMFAYKNSLLEAHQRNDIFSKIQICSSLIQSIVQIVILIVFKNYYLFIIIQLIVPLINQICIQIYTKKAYPQCIPLNTYDDYDKKKITTNMKNLIYAKFGGIILSSSDALVISAFLGLSTLALFQNYQMIVMAITGFLSTFLYGIISSIGNSIVTETKAKNYKDFKHFTFILSWIVCICTCCFLNIFQPFMQLWLGKEYMLSFHMVILFCVYFYIYEINQLLNLYKDAAGLWNEDRFRPLITSLVNLGLNVLLVNVWGVEGVLLSTIISMLFVGMPWLTTNLFTYLFEMKPFEYIGILLKYVVIVIICCFITYSLQIFEHAFIQMGFGLFVSVLIPSILYFVLFRNKDEFKRMIDLIQIIIRRKVSNK